MAKERLNCWEYMRCERNPEGKKAFEYGICPAASDSSFDGINFGKNAGRICWAVAGTFCGGKVQGTFAEKRGSCILCDFFRMVQKEKSPSSLESKFLNFLSEARITQQVAEKRYERGLVDYLTVLDAQQTRFQAEENIVLVDLAILTNRVALYRALGGSWAKPAPVELGKNHILFWF